MITTTQKRTTPKFKVNMEIIKYSVSVGIIVFGILMFNGLKALKSEPETQDADALVTQVNTSEVEPYSGVLSKTVTGMVVPHREIKVAAEVGGRVIEKFPACEAGNYVQEGEVLAKIDPQEYEIEIKTLTAEVDQARERIAETQHQIDGEVEILELVKKDFELQKREFLRNQKLGDRVLSKSELDQAQKALNAAETQLKNRTSSLAILRAGKTRLEAALVLANSRLEKAELNLERTTIKAPVDGIIVREIVQEGDFVSKGTQILMFEDLKQSEILVNLTPTELRWIRNNSDIEVPADDSGLLSVYQIPETEVKITDPANSSVSWQGTLKRFDGIGRDELTKTIPCRVMVENPIEKCEDGCPHALVRGMYVKCEITIQTTSSPNGLELFKIPSNALRANNHVWRVNEDSVLELVEVEVVDWNKAVSSAPDSEDDSLTQDIVIVRNTNADQQALLKSRDEVVTSPLSQPTNQTLVEVKNDFTRVAGGANDGQSTETPVSTQTKTSSLQ